MLYALAMPDAPPTRPATRKSTLIPIWIALALAVIVIAALSVNTAKFNAEMDRMRATGTYLSEITEWHPLRLFAATVWGRFWWLFGPIILCVIPGFVTLLKIVRLGRSK